MHQSYIRITFFTAELLTSADGSKQIPFRLQLKLPLERQVDPETAEKSLKFGFGFKLILTFVLLPLFAMLVYMSVSLLPFWELINALQILLHLPLLNVQLPGQVSLVNAQLLDVVRFSFWNPIEDLWDSNEGY